MNKKLSKAKRSTRGEVWDHINLFSKPHHSQQEMVGFVLIVVIVVVAAMVFLIISATDKESNIIKTSTKAGSLISAILGYTTDCAVVYEPNYDSVEELIKSCANNEICSNLNKPACSYLEEKLNDILASLTKTESEYDYYQLDVLLSDETTENELIPKLKTSGNCTGSILQQERAVSLTEKDVLLRITLCKSDI